MCFYVIEIMYFKAYSKIGSLNKQKVLLINPYFIEILISIEIYFSFIQRILK